MSCSSSLIDFADPLVLDTSVLINLHACRYGEQILAAIPNDIIVPEIVARELENEMSYRKGEHCFLHGLAVCGVVTLTNLTDTEFEIFHELTSTLHALDDGQAATIAVAVDRHLLPVIDERRAHSRAGLLMNSRAQGWSLDLFLHPRATGVLGAKQVVDALYLALRDGHMRIPSENVEFVITLLGKERSSECTCLPGHRE